MIHPDWIRYRVALAVSRAYADSIHRPLFVAEIPELPSCEVCRLLPGLRHICGETQRDPNIEA